MTYGTVGGANCHDRADDARLAGLARSGSEQAFEQLVDRYYASVVRIAYRLTRDRYDAQDIAQDAFARAFMRLAQFQADRPLSAWLFAAARNASLDCIRRRRRHDACDSALPRGLHDSSAEQVAMRRQDAEHVRAAIRHLPDRLREVLSLYYFAGMTYKEIAALLEMPLGSVKTSIFRGKHRMRDTFERDAYNYVA